MTFKEFRKHYPVACAEAFIEMKSDQIFWEAVEDWDLTELGKRVLIHLKGRKTDLENELEEDGFDASEAAKDVVQESLSADAKEHNRKLS